MNDSTNIFIVYHSNDSIYKEDLKDHLKGLELRKNVIIRSRSFIKHRPDTNHHLDDIIKNNIIILVLISQEFLLLNLQFDSKLNTVTTSKKPIILPIIVKECDWLSFDWVRRSVVLPDTGEAISTYEDKDEAYYLISKEVSRIVSLVGRKGKLASPENSLTSKNKAVFVSYSRLDSDFAELLKLKLEAKGFEVWLDSNVLNIGENWRSDIDFAISNAFALLLIVSSSARKSEYVTYEWAYALGKNIKVLPIIFEQTQMHPRLEALQYSDFSNRESRDWNNLYSRLQFLQTSSH